MMVRLKWYLDPPSPCQLKKNVVKVEPPLTKLSGSTHANNEGCNDTVWTHNLNGVLLAV